LEKEIVNKSDIQSAIIAGKKLAALQNIHRDTQETTHILVENGFRLEEIDNDHDRPARKRGTRKFISAQSFCSYVNKHQMEDETIVIADEDQGIVQAVINDHGESLPAWGDFQAILELGFSEQWKAWFYKNKTPFTQSEFVDFIEDNRMDIKTGEFQDADGNEVENLSPLELGALLSNLNITSEENFSSKINPVTGRMTMSYMNEETGKGSIDIPAQIFLAIPIYRSGGLFQIKVRLRHRTQGGAIRFHFIIDQMALLKEAAFTQICQSIEKGNIGSEENESKQFEGVGLDVLKGIINR